LAYTPLHLYNYFMKKRSPYKAVFFLAFFILGTTLAHAQSKHPIDQYLENCTGHIEGHSSAGYIGCMEIATEKWNTEVQANYKSLMSNLSDQQKSLLKNAHTDWVKYKEQYFKFLDELYPQKTAESNRSLAYEKMIFVKKYALTLKELQHTSAGL
jgi:uncharacterized protein YecT (DUF1311 family)